VDVAWTGRWINVDVAWTGRWINVDVAWTGRWINVGVAWAGRWINADVALTGRWINVDVALTGRWIIMDVVGGEAESPEAAAAVAGDAYPRGQRGASDTQRAGQDLHRLQQQPGEVPA